VSNTLSWGTPTFTLTFDWDHDRPVGITGFSSEVTCVVIDHPLPVIEILTASGGRLAASNRLSHTVIGAELRYVAHESEELPDRQRLTILTRSSRNDLEAVATFEIFHGACAVRSWVRVDNVGYGDQVLQAVPSLTFGLGSTAGTPAGDSFGTWNQVSGVSDWLGEGRWQSRPLRGNGFPDLREDLTGHNPRGAAAVTSSGTWSTGNNLPVAGLESGPFGAGFAWQIEHNGAWRWEVGEDTAGGYVSLSGPTDLDSSWSKILGPGASFVSVPATLAFGRDFIDAVGELTLFRRAARRPHNDNTALSIVFNDYMNTLNGDPTTEKLLPLVKAASEAGAEIFCIDAGWYDDSGHWWDSVGEWVPSATRFPNGLDEVIDAITAAGMVPGLWLEPEVVGVRSPLALGLPHEAFLQRHGSRIVEHGRFHLDLRHPAAIAHLDAVVDRLVADFGIGFFKFDYNIDPGAGTDHNADSVGDGLLEHNRAHLQWLDGVLDRHPTLVIENCSSGAMRTDFAILSRVAMQSTSDQQDFTKYPPIAASAPLSMLPEQAASWAYPQPEMNTEEAAFCLATGLLGRFYLSGYLNRMDEPALELVREASVLSKSFRSHIASSRPYWPAGLPGWDDEWVALGLQGTGADLLTVWNREATQDVVLHLPHLTGHRISTETAFPANLPPWKTSWDPQAGKLTIQTTAELSARVFRITSDTDQHHPHTRTVRG
jgi:alpha-galactosidase